MQHFLKVLLTSKLLKLSTRNHATAGQVLGLSFSPVDEEFPEGSPEKELLRHTRLPNMCFALPPQATTDFPTLAVLGKILVGNTKVCGVTLSS